MRLPQTENLSCHHLRCTARDAAEVQAFETLYPETGSGLERYLKRHALADEDAGVMRTYLVRFKATRELVGFFSLKAGLVSLNEVPMQQTAVFDTVPGVELANFAVNGAFAQRYNARGLGFLLFSGLIEPFVREHAKTIGIYMLYLFALPFPKLLRTYENYGFRRLTPTDEKLLHQRLKPAYDDSCIFMYQLLGNT